MRTVIEGVETTEHLKLAIEMGPVYAQGYLWSRPVPAEDVPAVMARLVRQVEHDGTGRDAGTAPSAGGGTPVAAGRPYPPPTVARRER